MQSWAALAENFNDETIDWLFSAGETIDLRAGDVVVSEGENPTSVWLVANGVFRVEVEHETLSHSVLGPGDLIGELSLLDGKGASATVTSDTDSTVLRLPRSAIEAALDEQPAIGGSFWRAVASLVAQRLRTTTNELVVATSSAPNGVEVPELVALRETIAEIRRIYVAVDTADGPVLDTEEAEMGSALKVMFDAFQTAIASTSEEVAGGILQVELLPMLLNTSVLGRSYLKPRGYAGDWFTIEEIYRNEGSGVGRAGPMLDKCLLQIAPCEAVRNRRQLLCREIERLLTERDHVAITSLACGPAREVFDVFGRLDRKSRLAASLVDLDQEALDDVTLRSEAAGLDENISTYRSNLIKLSVGRENIDLPPQNLVYSIGLIDYFPDDLVVRLLDYIHTILLPGGSVILGNFHPDNAAKPFMDQVVEWELIHRTEEDMNRLFRSSLFGRDCTRIMYEEQRINLFAECVKEN